MSERGYSVDLRQRVVDALARGLTQDEAAEQFDVGVATVYRWQRLHRENGSVAPLPHGGGHPRAIDPAGDELLRKLVAEKPDSLLPELAKKLNALIPAPAHVSSVSRALKRLGLTLKKNAERRREAPPGRRRADRGVQARDRGDRSGRPGLR